MGYTVGDVLAERTVHLTRESLVRYAGASGDFNPIHYRDDVAASVRLPGVLAHGMLTMGIASSVVVAALDPATRILDYGVRFTKPVVVDPTRALTSPSSPPWVPSTTRPRASTSRSRSARPPCSSRRSCASLSDEGELMREIEPVRLAELTTLRTGAAPERMFEATTTAGLVDALRETWARGDEWFILGGGSNLFVGDEPFEGTVIRVRTEGIDELPSPHAGRIRLRAQAGHGWDDLVAYAVAHGYAGLEAMSGIPGTVGAAPCRTSGRTGRRSRRRWSRSS